MNKFIPLTCLIAIALSSASFANKASDETIDILSAEASQTDMTEVTPATPEVVEPSVAPSLLESAGQSDALSASIAKQLSGILGSDTNQNEEKTDEKLEKMVASALLDGVNMIDLRSAVSAAMDDITATLEESSSEKIKQASQSLNKLVGESDPVNAALQKEVREIEAFKTPTKPVTLNGTALGTVTVLEGESLYKVALRVYGRGNDYLRLYNANKDILSDPNIIQVGQILQVP